MRTLGSVVLLFGLATALIAFRSCRGASRAFIHPTDVTISDFFTTPTRPSYPTTRPHDADPTAVLEDDPTELLERGRASAQHSRNRRLQQDTGLQDPNFEAWDPERECEKRFPGLLAELDAMRNAPGLEQWVRMLWMYFLREYDAEFFEAQAVVLRKHRVDMSLMYGPLGTFETLTASFDRDFGNFIAVVWVGALLRVPEELLPDGFTGRTTKDIGERLESVRGQFELSKRCTLQSSRVRSVVVHSSSPRIRVLTDIDQHATLDVVIGEFMGLNCGGVDELSKMLANAAPKNLRASFELTFGETETLPCISLSLALRMEMLEAAVMDLSRLKKLPDVEVYILRSLERAKLKELGHRRGCYVPGDKTADRVYAQWDRTTDGLQLEALIPPSVLFHEFAHYVFQDERTRASVFFDEGYATYHGETSRRLYVAAVELINSGDPQEREAARKIAKDLSKITSKDVEVAINWLNRTRPTAVERQLLEAACPSIGYVDIRNAVLLSPDVFGLYSEPPKRAPDSEKQRIHAEVERKYAICWAVFAGLSDRWRQKELDDDGRESRFDVLIRFYNHVRDGKAIREELKSQVEDIAVETTQWTRKKQQEWKHK